MKELEEQLQQVPTPQDVLSSHAATSTSFLAEKEKIIMKSISDKLHLLSEELHTLKKKRTRVSLKEKIMVEIETGRVGTRKDPVPALSKKIGNTSVHVNFLTSVVLLIQSLSSQLQINKQKASRTRETFRKQLEEKKKTIMNQGLRIRNYEQNAVKQQHANSMSNIMQPLSLVLDGLGPHNRIDTPAGTLILEPRNEMIDGIDMDMQLAVNEGVHGGGGSGGGSSSGGDGGATTKLEQSLKHVGGLPPMATALATDAPHLIAPHMLPNGGRNGDPRDNGKPGSRSSKSRRDQWMYDQKGSFKRATIPEMFQISTGRRDPLTGKIAWKGNGIFNRFDAIELFAGKTRNIYRQ